MVTRKGVSAREAGFTLIEIVMVLVLLGILAAVAVPKYFDLEDEARTNAFNASMSVLQANVNAAFAKALLEGQACVWAMTAGWHEIRSVDGYSIEECDGCFYLDEKNRIVTHTFKDSHGTQYRHSFTLPSCK